MTVTAYGQPAVRPGRVEQINAPPEIKAGMEEMWRRGVCQLSSVYLPAQKQAPVPAGIGTTPVLVPRLYNAKGLLLCYAADGENIWAADDQALYELNASSGKETRRYTKLDGFPDLPVQSIVTTGEHVWLATQDGLARLSKKEGRITVVPEVQCNLGRLAAGKSGVWLIGAQGAYRLIPGESKWKQLPAFPGQTELSEMARRGFWSRLWRDKLQTALPEAIATDNAFYAICFDTLLKFEVASGSWSTIARQVSQCVQGDKEIWCLTTGGLARARDGESKPTIYSSGQGLAAGRPLGLAVTRQAVWVISEPDYDAPSKTFKGGGISRLDLAAKTWTITEKVDGTDIRFTTAISAQGNDAWVACSLYDKIDEFSAHPGMAHVKRWLPHRTGIGLLQYRNGNWTLARGEQLKTEKRWVLGQTGEANTDLLGPQSVERICAAGGRIWGEYRVSGEKYYAGYYISAGCLAEFRGEIFKPVFDVRNQELDMTGEQPDLLLISLSHGEIVRGEGQPIVLGMEVVAGHMCIITESGVYLFNEKTGKFQAALHEPFRAYWRVTAAAVDKNAIWFGGDAGTISRLDRATGQLELMGVMKGRKITVMVATDQGIAVKSEKTDVVLPIQLAETKEIQGTEVVWDGKEWRPSDAALAIQRSAFGFEKDSDYLTKAGKRTAFVKGIFKPVVLCEDKTGGLLWLGTHNGVAAVRLP